VRLLFTGKGTSGSWQIRGLQVSKALGAAAVPMAGVQDCKAAHAIVAVKRIPDSLLETIRKSGRPWAWDVVDAFPQPKCSAWSRQESIDWLKGEVRRLAPTMVILPNERMRDDLGFGDVIYHHHRQNLTVNPIRERLEVIGYEGSPTYIWGWAEAIGKECARRGLTFMVNPTQLADVDVVLALRGEGWNGYPQRHWKSNVKLANAHGSGTPFIGSREAGYMETQTGAEHWADDPRELSTALDWLETRDARLAIRERFLGACFTWNMAAHRYREVLCKLKS